MSAFVIVETTNNKDYSTLLKTHIWLVSIANSLNKKMYLHAESQKH